MNSALTINQLLGAEPEGSPALRANGAATDLSQLSDEQLATIHGGCGEAQAGLWSFVLRQLGGYVVKDMFFGSGVRGPTVHSDPSTGAHGAGGQGGGGNGGAGGASGR